MQKKVIITLTLFVILFLAITIPVLRDDSPNYHDGETIFNGLLYLKTGNSFNEAAHGILTPILAATPLLFMDIDMPSFEEVNNNPKAFGLFDFLYYQDNDANSIALLAKMPMLFLAIILGLYVFFWAKELYGFRAGLLAISLYSLSPIILANAGLITHDITTATFFVITLYYYWKLMTTQKKRYFILTGLFLGLALMSKAISYLIIPILILCGLICLFYKRDLNFPLRYNHSNSKKVLNILLLIFLICLVGILVFCIGYSREIHPIYTSTDPLYASSLSARSDERLVTIIENTIPIENPQIKNVAYFILTKMPVPGPHYFQGLYTTNTYASGGMEEYFMGKYDSGVKWKYYIVSFFTKTPIPFLILLLLSFIFFKGIRHRDMLNEYFLLIPILFFILMLLPAKMYGGYRYFLPIFPLIIILISKIVRLKQLKNLFFLLLFILLLGWFAFGTVQSYPHYTSYFNEFVGMENGYKYFLNSDVDNFQDFRRLENYVAANNLTNFKMNVSASMTRPIYRFNFDYMELNAETPSDGIIIMNVNTLMGLNEKRSEYFEWLRNFEPIDRVGYSIFVYNITSEELIAKGYR